MYVLLDKVCAFQCCLVDILRSNADILDFGVSKYETECSY
jgi:hypothetical protein